MSLPKSRLEFGSAASRRSWSNRNFGGEDIDAHAGQRLVGLVRHAGRVFWLLQKRHDAVGAVDRHNAETGRFLARHLDAADRHIGLTFVVHLQHRLVVHLVDVVAGENDDVVRTVALDDVDVLIHRIGGAGVPLGFGNALAGAAGCRSFRCARRERNSSRAADDGSGCAPCIASPLRCGGYRNSVRWTGRNR